MNLLTKLSAVALAALAVSAAIASDSVKLGSLEIEHARAVATRPGQPNGAAFIEVENKGAQADRLIAVSFPKDLVSRGELHTMKHDGGKMIMREVPGFDIPAGGKLVLQPGGNHLMLMGIQKPLAEGATIPATLKFEKAGEITLQLKVVGMKPHKGHDDSHHGSTKGHGDKPHGMKH